MITFYKNGYGLEKISEWTPNSWVHIEHPTEEDKNFLLNDLQVPEAFYNDIEDTDERPRLEIEDDGWYFILLRVPYKNLKDKVPYSTLPLGIIFRNDIFITLSFHKLEMIDDFILFSKRKNIIKKNNFDLVLRLHLSASVWFLKYLKQINQRIRLAEDKLESSIRNEDLQTLLQIEKCLVYFTTSIKGNDFLIHKIRTLKEHRNNFDEELVEDVDIELRQAQETTNIYSDILSGMMDAYASVISNNLNIIMKQLTSISIILMIPNLIASLYGMNVPNALENKSYGFWTVLLISFVLSAFGVFVFRKRNLF